MPSHRHSIYSGYSDTAGTSDAYRYETNWAGKNTANREGLVSFTGGSKKHNNVQPYEVVFVFKRSS